MRFEVILADISALTNKTENIAIMLLVAGITALGAVLIYYIKHSLGEKKRLTDMLMTSFEESKTDRRRYEDNLLGLATSNAADREKYTAAFRENTQALQEISKTVELVPIIQGQLCSLQEDVKLIISKETKSG